VQIFRRKQLSEVRDSAGQSGLVKSLGPVDLIFLGLGGIIGTGIFVLTGLAAAQYAGPAITLSFLLGGIACVFTALAFAELASMLPVSGSAYSYAQVTLGEGMSMLVGWTIVMVFSFGSATVASGWSGYVLGILDSAGIQLPAVLTKIPSDGGWINLPAVFIVILLTAIVVRGTQSATRFNGLLVVVKLLAIFLFVFLSVPHVDMKNWADFAPHGFDGITAGAAVIFMAYTGFDAVATAAEECKNPNRDLPIGIIGSLVGSGILYVLVSGLLTSIVHYSKLNNSQPMAFALRENGISIGATLVATGAIAGMTTVILTQIFAQARILLMMSRDGLMPQCFGSVHPKYSTPYIGIISSGVLVVLIAGFLPVSTLGQISSMATLMVFGFVSLAVMILRYTRPEERRPFKCPAVYWVASLSCGLCFFLFSQLFWTNWKPYLLFSLGGMVIYLGYGYWNSKARLLEQGR
jgi:APA family basic amino acid/polyamine antiporter